MKRYALIKSFALFFLLIALAGCGPTSSGSSLLPSDNQGGNSNPPPSLFPPATPPPIPVITTANALANRVELDWSDTSAQEDGFIIERDGIQITSTSRNISAWTDTNVQPGTTYCYAVHSYNVVGKSNASPLECATVPLPPAPINNPPTISALITTPPNVEISQQSSIACQAFDLDNDPLTFNWSANAGIISGSGSTVQWTAPDQAGNYTIQCSVSDNKGGNAAQVIDILATDLVPTPAKWILPQGAETRSFATNQATGELYAAGMTYESLPGFTNAGMTDMFLAKFNPDGTLVWLQQWGTPYFDLVLGDFLAISDGNIYVLCNCNDASGLGGGDPRITVFNPQGDILRIVDLLGRSGTESIAADDDGVYVVFYENNVGQVVAKFDYQANDPIVWATRSQEYIIHVALYGNAIYGVGANATKSYIAQFDRETGNALKIAYQDERYYLDAIAVDAAGVYAIESFFKLTALKYPHDLADVSLMNNLPGSGQLYGAAPAQDNGSLYFAVSEAGLFRLDKGSLQVVWQRADVKGSATVLIGDVLLVASENKISHYDALTGGSLP